MGIYARAQSSRKVGKSYDTVCLQSLPLIHQALHLLSYLFPPVCPTNFLPMLTLNHDSPNRCLSSSWNYRYEPLYLAPVTFFETASLSKPLLQHPPLPNSLARDIPYMSLFCTLTLMTSLSRLWYTKQSFCTC
jgi:hypothetical protein